VANFTAGTSFTDGVTNDVTAAKLNALVADAVPTANLSLNSTTGTVSNFTTSTATINGPITASTAVINVGSGQIYKDASGKVGIGTASPGTKLDVVGGRSNFSAASEPYGVGVRYVSTGGPVYFGAASASATPDAVISAAGGNVITTFTNDGNVGIGITSPTKPLTVKANSVDGVSVRLIANGNEDVVLDLFNASGTTQKASIESDVNSALKLKTVNIERLRIDSSGGVTIAGLAGSGSRAVNASAAGLLSAASDASLKEEVVGAHIAGLDEILQIHPKMYRWKDDIANRGDEASVELGFIANDVAPIIPSAAPMGNDGLYGFYDRSITAALVKAVQELSAKVTALEAA